MLISGSYIKTDGEYYTLLYVSPDRKTGKLKRGRILEILDLVDYSVKTFEFFDKEEKKYWDFYFNKSFCPSDGKEVEIVYGSRNKVRIIRPDEFYFYLDPITLNLMLANDLPEQMVSKLLKRDVSKEYKESFGIGYVKYKHKSLKDKILSFFR